MKKAILFCKFPRLKDSIINDAHPRCNLWREWFHIVPLLWSNHKQYRYYFCKPISRVWGARDNIRDLKLWEVTHLLTDCSYQTCTHSDVVRQIILHPQCNTMTPAGPAKRHWVRAWLFTVKSITTALTVAAPNTESTALPGERQRALTADWLLGEALCEVKGHDGCGRAQGPAGVLPQRVRLRLARLAEVQRALVGRVGGTWTRIFGVRNERFLDEKWYLELKNCGVIWCWKQLYSMKSYCTRRVTWTMSSMGVTSKPSHVPHGARILHKSWPTRAEF